MTSRMLEQALMIAWLTMSFGAIPIEAQVPQHPRAQLEDVVYLKDGGIVRGTIVEHLPNESVLIRTRDGNQFRYRMDHVERMTREAPVRPAPLPRARQSVGGAVVLSLLLAGAGQAYNEQWGKAAGFLLGSIALYGAASSAATSEECWSGGECAAAHVWLILWIGNTAWSMIDAGYTANRMNREMQRSATLILRPAPTSELGGAAASFDLGGPIQVGVRLAW